VNRIGDTLAEVSGRAAGRHQTWRAPASQEPLSRSARAFGRATSHLILGAVTGTGPAQDWPDFTPAKRQAAGLLRFDTALVDSRGGGVPRRPGRGPPGRGRKSARRWTDAIPNHAKRHTQ
jgi:hypothetical protein